MRLPLDLRRFQWSCHTRPSYLPEKRGIVEGEELARGFLTCGSIDLQLGNQLAAWQMNARKRRNSGSYLSDNAVDAILNSGESGVEAEELGRFVALVGLNSTLLWLARSASYK